MNPGTPSDLTPLFASVAGAMRQNRDALNQSDPTNGNHGEHMLEIFNIASQVFQENQAASPAVGMQQAAQRLAQLADNGSAQEYARGLAALGVQFNKAELTQEELLGYLSAVVNEKKDKGSEPRPVRSGEVLKALVAGLAAWQRSEISATQTGSPIDLSYMFDLGIAYLKAKQHNSTRLEAMAEAAVSVSPLSQVPHRAQSGKMAILALLQALETHD